jgi:hypothetical protein
MRREQRAANVRRMTRPFSKIEVLIETLTLHGFSPGDRSAIGDGLSRELERLFTDAEAPASLTKAARLASLDAGQIVVSPNAKPVSVGKQIAQAVHGNLNQDSRGNRR